MDNSTASASTYETSNLQVSVASSSSASVDALSHAFGNLQVNDNNAAPATVPLYAQSIWASTHDSSSNGMNSGAAEASTSSFNFRSISSSGFEANPFENRTINTLNRSSPLNGLLRMAEDQRDSEYLQHVLISSRDRILIAFVFEMVYVYLFEVMTSQHGRFVFGKFVESCNLDQLQLIAIKLTSQDKLFLSVSQDNYGSSSIKKLIRVLADSPLLSKVMFTLRRLFRHLMVTKPGSSIIFQCLNSIYSRNNDFIYQAALEHCLALANNGQGCISMKTFIDEMRGPRRRQILHLISMNAAYLSRNEFGNYVVQHVLGLENPELIETICLALRGHFVDLSLRKYGSHVVEKCLKIPIMVQYVVEEFINSNQILQVANDPFGNYVMQTALRVTMKVNIALHQRLVMELQQYLPALKLGKGRRVCNLIISSLQ